MKDQMKFKDLVDLAYFIASDNTSYATAENGLHKRDRQYCLEAQSDTLRDDPTRIELLQTWLSARKASGREHMLSAPPGKTAASSLKLLRILVLCTGIMTGAAGGFSYFVYTGETPLNILTFIALFIFPQLLLIFVTICRSLLLGFLRKTILSAGKIWRSLFLLLFSRLRKIDEKMRNTPLLPQQEKEFMQQTGELFFYPLFTSSQLFGISFNVGLITLTLFKIITSDLAFGWQTTLQIGPERLFQFVTGIATVWTWLIPPEATLPNLAQIEGSRIILKEGIYNLATENLVSWWPFLLMTILFYGLLPRLVLFAGGLILQKRKIHRFLNKRDIQRICERMRTPVVSTQAAPQHFDEYAETIAHGVGQQIAREKKSGENKESILLIPDELFSTIPAAQLESSMSSCGYTIVERLPIFKSYNDDLAIITTVPPRNLAIIMIIEAWMPPINEHLVFLEEIAARSAENCSIEVCLLGKPQADEQLVPPLPESRKLWLSEIAQRCPKIGYVKLDKCGKEKTP